MIMCCSVSQECLPGQDPYISRFLWLTSNQVLSCEDLVKGWAQKYNRLRCLLRAKGLVFRFYLGWSGSILQFRQNIIKVGSKSWLLICSSNITLSLPSYNGSALKRVLNFCNDYFSLLHFCRSLFRIVILRVQNVNRIFPLRMLTLADSNKMSKNSSW